MKIFLLLSFSLLSFFGLSAQTYFTVKFPDDRTVQGCGQPVLNDWPEISQTPYCNFGVGVSVKDQIFYTNGNTCGKILRRYRLLYWCDYDPNWQSYYIIMNPPNTDVGPTVVASPQNHGYLEYTQVIKFLDGNVPQFLDCPAPNVPVVFCDYSTNDPTQYHNVSSQVDLCEGVVNLKTKVTDACSKANLMLSYRLWLDLDGNGIAETFRSSSDPLAWPIELTKTADTLSGRVKFPAGFGLPYGKNMIEWIAMDNCGNQSLCKYQFIVKDCSPPTAFCYNGLSVNIMETGMITLWAKDFLQKKFDNCTPESQIKVAIRKKGTGTGFPTNSTGVTFDCNELGIQDVEIWVADAYGNASHCDTYLDVQDPMDVCTVPKGTANSRGDEIGVLPKTIFYPPAPNPSNDGQTVLSFNLSASGEVALTLTDATGRVLESSHEMFSRGHHELPLELGKWSASGLVFAQIRTAGGTVVQKIFVQ